MGQKHSSQPASTDSAHPPPITASSTELPTTQPADDAPSTTSTLTPGPPSLEYTVRTRIRILWILAFWSLVITDSIFMPIALYFGLWYGTNLSPNTVFSIVTAAIGGVSILEYFVRFYRLWKKGSTCRVIGGRRWHLDSFHWIFTFSWIVIMVELIIGSTPENPPIRLVAMPPASLLFVFGVAMIILEALRWLKWPSLARISSQPRGTVLRPAVYSLIEDIVAVDGSGGKAYRERLDKRYQASHVFRCMLERITVFWMIGTNAVAVLTTVLIFTLTGDEAYAVGWSVPFVWAGIWALASWWYVEHMLKVEKRTWGQTEKA